ncbi:MAG: endonuclease [Bacteroidales bacterium]|nr:endonuclease [Bacteroidales bacterium]
MNTSFLTKVAVPVIFLFAVNMGTVAQPPQNYYSDAEGKSGYALKTALHNIIKNHRTLSYSSLWTAYQKTDIKEGTTDKVWDMYSDCDWTYRSDQCGSYSNECDCYNREHSFPKSWFNEASPMQTDLVHIVPTDGKVNGMRSNNPFGNVGSATYTSGNGSKLGNCGDCGGYTKKVFEPIDEYKGDFARIYFYMVTCYEDKVAGWNGSGAQEMLDGTSNQAFKDWAKNLLLQWHRQDPVSDKEKSRNNGIEEEQGNRNPFVDYPELVEKIWGNDNTKFLLDLTSIETHAISDDAVFYEMYPAAEIISILGTLLKQTTSLGVNTDIDEFPRGIYIVKYIHRDGKNFLSKKIVK